MNDITPSWERPNYGPHVRWRALFAAAVTLVAGIALGHSVLRTSGPSVVPVIAPVKVTLPAPAITVTVPPAPVVAPPAPIDVTPVPPRAMAPVVRPECILEPATDDGASPTCGWDDGFPAISADGAMLVTKDPGLDDARGLPSLAIDFIDARTSRVVRRAVVLAPEESDFDGSEHVDAAKRAALVGKLDRRARLVQAELDAGHYRSLRPLADAHEAATAEDPAVRPTTTYAEIAGAQARIVDPSTATVLWEATLDVPARTPRTRDPEAECGGWSLVNTTLWWDPASKTVLGRLHYVTGGCMCPDADFDVVRHMP